ncbi:hypothetical protein FHX08_003315 [Rhizobium sp. BK529]|nr:hypothetical protein [Rhizobium sp. BK529]TCS07351.1 hypothetical protein EV281_102968 [Rhizobium sp. BK418]
MVDRPARVVAQIYGQAGRSISRPVSANPGGLLANQLGPGIVAPGEAIGSDVSRGMPVANRFRPDTKLLRQNASS